MGLLTAILNFFKLSDEKWMFCAQDREQDKTVSSVLTKYGAGSFSSSKKKENETKDI